MSIINFSYFDQFSDIEVNLAPFLNDVKLTSGFDYSFTNIQTVKTTLKNLFDRIDIANDFRDLQFFDSHTIQEGETPESISFKYYDTVDNWWLICIFNDIENLYNDWPMTEDQLNTIAESMFKSEGKHPQSTYYNLLFERNETKRHVLILKPFYINDVVSAFRAEFEKYS